MNNGEIFRDKDSHAHLFLLSDQFVMLLLSEAQLITTEYSRYSWTVFIEV